MLIDFKHLWRNIKTLSLFIFLVMLLLLKYAIFPKSKNFNSVIPQPTATALLDNSEDRDFFKRIHLAQKLITNLEKLVFRSQLKIESQLQRFPGKFEIDWRQSIAADSNLDASKEGHFKILNNFLSTPALSYSFANKRITFSAFGVAPTETNSEEKIIEYVRNKNPNLPIIPLNHLSYWIFGIPSPSMRVENLEFDDIPINSMKLIVKMDQLIDDDIWNIRFFYPETTIGDFYPLPEKIYIAHPRSQIVFNLVPTNFDVNKSFHEHFMNLHGLKELQKNHD